MRCWWIALLLASPLPAQEEDSALFAVAGTVRSPSGKAVAGTIHLFDALATDRPLAQGRIDDQGRFQLVVTRLAAARREHPFGPVRLSIHCPGLARAERQVTPESRTDIELVEPAVWAGIVKGRDGNPLPGAPVVAQQGTIRVATTSDENGRFSFADLGPAPTRVRADASGFRAATIERGKLIFRLEPLPLREGQVIDARTKRPLAGVHLVALESNVEAESDHEGRFAMELEEGGSEIAAYLDGYAIGKQKFDGGAISMRRAPPVSGSVVDEKRQPVPFAQVRLDPGFGAPRLARTDESGAFSFPVGVNGFAFVHVTRRGYLPARATVDANWRTDRVRIALRKGRTIEGVVLAEGEPRPGAEVIVYRALRPAGREEVARAYADAEGGVVLRSLPSTAAFAQARFMGLRSPELAIERKIWFRLERRPPISGIVRDDTGKPVAGLNVAIEPRHLPDQRTDEEGRFEFQDLPLAKYHVVVERSEEVFGIRRSVVPGSRVELTLERIRGPHRLVLRFDTKRAHPARVELRGPDWRRIRWVAAEQTAVAFDGLATGSYQVSVDTPGFQDAVRDVAVAEDKPQSGYQLDLARAGTLRLRATAGAMVYIQTLHGEPAPVVSVRLDKGEAELVGFGPGGYRIIARAPGQLVVIEQIEVGPKDPPRALDLTGEPAATLRLTVTDGARKPLRGVSITLVTPSGFLLPVGQMTDAEGLATLRRLVKGSLTVVAEKGDRRSEKSVVIKPGSDSAVTLILE